MNRNLSLSLVLFTALAAAAGSSRAASPQTASFTVSAQISANCTISAGDLQFGAYDPIVANAASGSDATATADITTTCTTGSSPLINLSLGDNSPGAGLRQMASGANRLSYNLYTDNGHNTLWDVDSDVPATTPDGTPHVNTVFGLLPKGQNKPVGSYSDVVVASVSF
jgi:spore coat protein U-like protein